MPRSVKIALPALVVLGGLWLAISGVLSFFATKVDGMYVTGSEGCFFIPDILGWLGRIWQAVVVIAGVVLLLLGTYWLFAVMKPDQPCACASGRSYRQCCFPRERAYLVVGGLTVGILVGAHMLDSSYVRSIGILMAAGLAFWLVGHHYRRHQPRAKRV